MTRDDEVEARLRERLDAERLAADMFDEDPTGQDAEGAYAYGCGLYDTVVPKGRRLVNDGRTCDDAGEPYRM